MGKAPPQKRSIPVEVRISKLLQRIGENIPDFDFDNDFQLAAEAYRWSEQLSSQHNLHSLESISKDRIAVLDVLSRYAKVDRATYLAALLYPPFVQLVTPPPYDEKTPDYLALLEEKYGAEIRSIVEQIIFLHDIHYLPLSEQNLKLPEKPGDKDRFDEKRNGHRHRFLMMVLFQSVEEPRAALVRQAEALVRFRSMIPKSELIILEDYEAIAQQQVRVDEMEQTYMPMAAMAGFWLMRNALANAKLKYEHREIFLKIRDFRKKYTSRFERPVGDTRQDAVLQKIKEQVETELLAAVDENGICVYEKKDIKVEVRFKSIESIYKKVIKKMAKDNVPPDRYLDNVEKYLGASIHDYIGVRVTLSDKYIKEKAELAGKNIIETEGVESRRVHTILRTGRIDSAVEFNQVPGRWKDYTETPKDNGYSAVQDTYAVSVNLLSQNFSKVRSDADTELQGEIEVQSGSQSMFYKNEYGSAAHILFKMKGYNAKASRMMRAWLKGYREACQRKLPSEFVDKQIVSGEHGAEEAKVKNLIAVYVSDNDIVYMPKDSTFADLAAKLKVIAHVVGIKSISRINRAFAVPQKNLQPTQSHEIEDLFKTRLQNGDRIEFELDRNVLDKELKKGGAPRQSAILAALTNPSAILEVGRYFRSRKLQYEKSRAPT